MTESPHKTSDKPARKRPVTLHPLTFEKALEGLLKAKPPDKPNEIEGNTRKEEKPG